MPGTGGLAAIPELRKAAPHTAILVFTMHHHAAYVHEAMRAGARGYVLKSAPKEELDAGDPRAPRGRRISAARDHRHGAPPPGERRARGGRRTPRSRVREIQILESVADGKSNKEIASALAIAEDTVKTHLRRLFEKLGAADRAQAVAIALRQNLID